jgi:uncharacterized protein YkwD
MRTVAVSVATFAALLAATQAHASASKREATWQLRAPAAAGSLSSLQSRSLRGGTFRARSATSPSAPAASRAVLSAYEGEVVQRVNAIRAARGRRPLRVSRQLSAAAAFHTNQMGLRGFFEHESANGAEFWRRIERFYPALPRRSWSVGENIAWGRPDLSPAGAVREWMNSPPHRANLLSREWREIGLGAAHFAAAPGTFRGGRVTIVTADFGTRA